LKNLPVAAKASAILLAISAAAAGLEAMAFANVAFRTFAISSARIRRGISLNK
jgi:hypothetical protein